MADPEFLINDFLESSRAKLASVVSVSTVTLEPQVASRALFLKEFVTGMSQAYNKTKKPRRTSARSELELRRQEIQERLKALEQKPQLTEVSAVQPLPALDNIPEPH